VGVLSEGRSGVSLALVTGGSRGIGRAIAIELARRGHQVAINYRVDEEAARETVRLVEQVGGKAHVIQADASQPDEVARMFEALDAMAAADATATLDVLVCNAGIARDTLLGASTPADFDDVLATNLGGVVACCRLASKRMISRRRGAIVNLSSVAAQRPGRGQSNYAASKGAIEAFTRALAVELAPRGIRVNAVAPGIIETAMTEELRAVAPDELIRRVVMKRLGKPEEVARVVAFLCGEDCSYVTGQVWNVDGGFKLD